MRTGQALLVAVVVAALGAGGAAAGSVTPPSLRAQAQATLSLIHASDLAVFPTRLPAHYAFDSYSVSGSPASLNVTFADKRFEATSAQLGRHAVSYDVSYFRGKRCSDGASHSLRLDGVTLYEDANLVWRCVPAGRHVLVESAHGRASKSSLAVIVASARG